MRLRSRLTVFMIGIGTFFAVVAVGVQYGFARAGVADLDEGLPDTFAVVLYSSSDDPMCRVVFWRDVPRVKLAMSSWSYLVPEDRSHECQNEIRVQAAATPGLFAADYEVARGDGEYPVYAVFATWDDDAVNRSWYEATDVRIVPRRHQSFSGPGLMFSLFPYAAVVALLSALFARQVLLRRDARAA